MKVIIRAAEKEKESVWVRNDDIQQNHTRKADKQTNCLAGNHIPHFHNNLVQQEVHRIKRERKVPGNMNTSEKIIKQ